MCNGSKHVKGIIVIKRMTNILVVGGIKYLVNTGEYWKLSYREKLNKRAEGMRYMKKPTAL